MRTIRVTEKTYKVQEDGRRIGEYNGRPSEITEINVVASEVIPQFKPVIASGYVADSSNLSHVSKVLGISIDAVAIGFVGNIQSSGEIVNNSWTWAVGDKIFVNQKNLSNVVPTSVDSVWCQQIGVAIRSNTIVIDIKPCIRF